MRISASFKAILASGLLSQSAAQAVGYGSPDGSPSGNPTDGTGNFPAGNPNGAPGSVPGGLPGSNVPGTLPPGNVPAGSSGGNPTDFIPNAPGGAPGTVPGGVPVNVPIPAGVPNPSVPGGFPNVVPGGFPNGAAGGVPNSFPSTFPGGAPNGMPGSIPNGAVPGTPTCPSQSTTTVFVTVYPTTAQSSSGGPIPGGSSPGSSSPGGSPPGGSPPGGSSPGSFPGGTSPDGSSPDGSGPDGSSPDGSLPNGSGGGQTVVQPPNPTSGPALPGSASKTFPPPFTTLTIDLWGPSGGESNPDDASGSGNISPVDNTVGEGNAPNPGGAPDPALTDAATAPEYSAPGAASNGFPGVPSEALPNGGVGNTQASIPIPSQAPGSGLGGLPTGQPFDPMSNPGQQASGSLPFSTQGGPQLPGGSSPWWTVAPGNGNGGPSAPSITIIGPDGLPTIVPGGSLPFSTQGGPQLPGGSSPWWTVAPGNGNGSPSTPSTTIIGPDGLPTIIAGGTSLPQGQGQPIPVSSSVPQGSGQGIPQGISSGLPFPLSNVPALPTFVPQGPVDGSGASFPGGIPVQGITTCATLTITGADGLPTVVDSTWVIPFNTPIIDASAALPAPPNTLGPLSGIPGSIPTGSIPLPGSPQDGSGGIGVTTCSSWTVTGPDGLPTVLHSTWVIPDAVPTFGVPGGLPGPVITAVPFPGAPSAGSGGLPTGAPGAPVVSVASDALGGDGGITTCTSYTIVGSDGLPTVVDTTWVIPGPLATILGLPGNPTIPSAASNALPNGIPPAVTTQSNVLPGFPPSETAGGPGGSGGPGGAAGPPINGGITTCTSYTVIGPDGLPTIVDSTWVIPASGGLPTGVPALPSVASNALPSGFPGGFPGGIPGQPTGAPSFPSSGDAPPAGGITTCTSFTIIGSDGRPTVVDSTWVIPFSNGQPTGAPGAPGSPGSPGFPGSGDAPPAGGITTSTSFTIIGADGRPTVVDSTWVVPTSNGQPTATTFGVPPGLPQATVTGVPLPVPIDGSNSGPIAIVTTATIIGPDGRPTPVVQTVLVGAPDGLPRGTVVGVPAPPPSGPVFASSGLSPPSNGVPSLGEYGPVLSGPQTLLPPTAASVSAIIFGSTADAASNVGGILASGTITGTRTSTLTIVVGPSGGPIISGGTGGPLPAYDDTWGNGAPLPGSGQLPDPEYGPVPSEITLWPASSAYGVPPGPFDPAGSPCSTTLQTSTWANVITEQTTSYTINFPLTTLVTLAGAKRVIRRQESSIETSSAWANTSTSAVETLSENTSLGASLSSALSTVSSDLPTLSSTDSASTASDEVSTLASALPTPSICSTGGRIGNTTLDFDNAKPGPLFNPHEDIWFSQGFLIAPPSSQESQPYLPSSGGQLVEFVPPALSNTTTTGSGDVAQIGVGPNAAASCFNFDFFGASLGCDTEGSEEWCEFEISAYRYNSSTSTEESIAWSETKRVPACPTIAEGGCQLTPIVLDGYTNITSVLITLHVGLDLRVWWGDDFKVGWSDNSCEAAACRAGVPARRVKRETVEWALRRGVWMWAASGLQRLDDVLV